MNDAVPDLTTMVQVPKNKHVLAKIYSQTHDFGGAENKMNSRVESQNQGYSKNLAFSEMHKKKYQNFVLNTKRICDEKLKVDGSDPKLHLYH